MHTHMNTDCSGEWGEKNNRNQKVLWKERAEAEAKRRARRQLPAQWGGLVVDASALRFDGAEVGRQNVQPLRVHNRSGAALQVRFACPPSDEFALAVSPPVATVAAHRRARFAVSFTLNAPLTVAPTIDVLATTATGTEAHTFRQTVTLSAAVAPCAQQLRPRDSAPASGTVGGDDLRGKGGERKVKKEEEKGDSARIGGGVSSQGGS